MAQLRSIVNEGLQATVRRLLPSQQGFTEDLQASNVIQPIIDLTPSAGGGGLPTDLARAISFQSANTFNFAASSGTIVNNAGFWRITGVINITPLSSNNPNIVINLTDGTTTKIILRYLDNATGAEYFGEYVDFNVFIASGESLTCSATAYAEFTGSYRQIAEVDGTVVNPKGYSA